MWFVQLFYKEFLQLRPVLIVGLLTLTILVLGMHGSRIVHQVFWKANPVYPFGQSFNNWYFTIAYPLAVIVGLWQTLWEFGRGTWLFLLHRPRPMARLMLAKILSGLLPTLLVILIPAIFYVAYLSMPGALPGPLEWSYFGEFARRLSLVPILHFAAFATGVRGARWYASRLLPLLCGCLLSVLCLVFGDEPLLLCLMVIAVMAIQMADLLRETRQRDFS